MSDKTDLQISIFYIFYRIWKSKIVILSISVAFFVIILIISIFMSDVYESKTTFTPIANSQAGGISAAISQYSGLAQLAGVSIPGDSSTEHINTIINILDSRTLRDRIVKSLNLVDKLLENVSIEKRDPLRVAEEELKKILVVQFEPKTTSFLASIETKDGDLSKNIISQLLFELENMLNEYNLESATKNIKLLERQLDEQSGKVEISQRAMADFQTRNKLLDPSTQSEGYYEVFNNLTTQKIQLEILLRQLEEAYNPTDTRIQSLKNQIQSINTQLREIERTGGGVGSSLVEAPELLIEYQNLFRDLEISQKLYSALLASLEQTRLSIGENQVFIRIIDRPIVPDVKSGPSRTLIVLFGTLVGFLISIIAIFVKDVVNTFKIKFRELN